MNQPNEEKPTIDLGLAPLPPPGDPLRPIVRKKRRTLPAAFHEDPIAELRRLVQRHKNLTRTAVRLDLMTKDRKLHRDCEIGKKGDVIKCLLPESTKVDLLKTVEGIKEECSLLERQITRELKTVPIYEHFLRHVFGCGPVSAGYLCAMIRIERAPKVSNLRRYCGYALDTSGRLERRAFAPKYNAAGAYNPAEGGTYNNDLRRTIWLLLVAMERNSKKRTKSAPHGCSTKYLDVWRNAQHTALSLGKTKDFAKKKGMHKAADVFIEDLYVAWRALAGLPVWPSFYATKLGFAHGGKITINEPKILSIEEALALIGDVSKRPLPESLPDLLGSEEEAEGIEEDAAE